MRMRGYDRRESRWSSLVWGVGLITMGVLFTLHYLHLMAWNTWRVWWPALVLFFGAMQLLTARRPRTIGGAVTVLLMGAWFVLVTNGYYGLTWHNSWPLALVAVGCGTVVRAIASFAMRPDDPETEVHVDAYK